MAATEEPDLELRPAQAPDLARIHEVFVTASASAGHPEELRPPEEVRAWVDGLVVPPQETWVATTEGVVEGFVTVRGAWVTLLFVDPRRERQGVGSALLDLVKGLRPDGFGLRVHQANHGARAFYARHGLIELEQTDGSSYQDAAPDLQMAWPGPDPLGYLRGRIDEVDDELAVLLARRAALTAAVQDQKAATGSGAGPAGRDPGRERDIVERMARHVPGLGAERIGRVMHAVIEESLAAWEERG